MEDKCLYVSARDANEELSVSPKDARGLVRDLECISA